MGTKLLELRNTAKHKAIPEHLERLLVQLDFNDFHLNWQTLQSHLLAVDLPINPYPMESFVKKTRRPRKREMKPKAKAETESKTNSYEYLTTKMSTSTKSADSLPISMPIQAQTHQADDMLSKLNAVLNPNPNSNSNPKNDSAKPFVPSFVFPGNGNAAAETSKASVEFGDAVFGQTTKYRTTAPFLAGRNSRDAMIPTPLKARASKEDIFAKYDFGETPRAEKGMAHSNMGAIPHHLLPTPLQKKTATATTTAQKYAFDGGNGSGFVDDAENENANVNVNVPQSLSPSGIRFSFGDAARTGSNMPAMSPIPFTRNLGKGDASEVADQ